MTKARLEIGDRSVSFRPVGLAKVWAGQSRIDLPFSKITSVRTTDDLRSVWWGVRWAGTSLPRRVVAGWMGWPWRRAWWCVGTGRPLLVVDAPEFGTRRVVVSTDDPKGDAQRLREAVDRNT